MKLRELKSLEWGDTIVPSPLHRKTFRTGKRIESGLYLGLNKWGRLRVVTQDSGTVYYYHRDFWLPKPPKKRGVK